VNVYINSEFAGSCSHGSFYSLHVCAQELQIANLLRVADRVVHLAHTAVVERVPGAAGTRICRTTGNFSREVSIWIRFQGQPARNVDSWSSRSHPHARRFPDRLSRLGRDLNVHEKIRASY
jgi:hypothetical protein